LLSICEALKDQSARGLGNRNVGVDKCVKDKLIERTGGRWASGLRARRKSKRNAEQGLEFPENAGEKQVRRVGTGHEKDERAPAHAQQVFMLEEPLGRRSMPVGDLATEVEQLQDEVSSGWPALPRE